MSGWKFKYQLRDNSLGYTGRTTMDNDRPLAERVARLEAALAQLTARYERGATEPADPPGTQCGEPSPYTHDKCQEIKGHTHAHHAGLLDAWERTPSEPQPYRMTEPTNIGAVVEEATNLPHQNCTLTANDPEPPVGSVVLDRDGGAWQRLSLDWCLAGLDDTRGWNGLREVGPLTLIHRGPDPEPPTYRMAEPQNVGAVVVSEGLRYVRIESQREGWTLLGGLGRREWADLDNPQPFQNCVLTFDDPEPPGGSVVRCDDDSVWQSETGGDWRGMDDVNAYEWTRLLSDRHPVTLLYRGEG